MAQANKDSTQDKPDQVESDLTHCEKRIQHFHEFHLNGKHENQVFEGEEVNLHKHFIGCEKNPGHKMFIPYNEFKMDDIPKSHRDQDMFDFIKVVADLTVRIQVACVSPNRPEFWPNTRVKYPLHGDHEKKDNSHTGSGQVNEVIKFENGKGPSRHGKKLERSYDACICVKCKDSGKPKKDWWEIVIRTASHVVFDEFEAIQTKCRLFFDSNVVENSDDILKEMNLLEVNVNEDWCLLSHVWCDDHNMKNRDRLLNLVKQRVELWSKVCQKHKKKGDKMTFIVSHPHGCSKQVSFGYLKTKLKLGEFEDKSGKFDQNKMDRTKLRYNTPTCKGSSGAPVRCVWLGEGYVHSLSKDDDDVNDNYSGVSLVYRHGSPFLKNAE